MLRCSVDGLTIRALTAEDAEEVAALVTRAFAAQPVKVDPAPSALRVTRGDVVSVLGSGGGAAADVAGVLLGAVLWEEKDGGLYVSRLSVAPEWRGRGIAARLLVAAEDATRALGLPRMHLGTRLTLERNRRLFVRCGFREVAFHAHPGYAAPTWVEMEKWLSAPAEGAPQGP